VRKAVNFFLVVENLRGKNLENAGETNFFLASEVVFFGVQVNISCEGVW
jgi:hypothetical protein